MKRLVGTWVNLDSPDGRAYRCGFCDKEVSAHSAYSLQIPDGTKDWTLRICPHCNRPTYFEGQRSWPSPGFGSAVRHLPPEVGGVWTEARDATAAGCPTAAVLLLRKLLMHIAVDLGAPDDQNFVEYVTHLAEQHVIPPQASGWTDEVRKQGNEKNHEITVSTPEEARELMVFMEFLLKGVYEFPGDLKARQAPPAESTAE